jgi:hypothetical protein
VKSAIHLGLGVKPARRLVWQFGDIPDESSFSLPLPQLSIVLSQRQRILQATRR